MKRFWLIVYTWCLLLLLGVGVLLLVVSPKESTYSATENRMLAPFPKTDAESILSGDFSVAFEQYLSDRFFERDRCIAVSDRLRNACSLLSGSDRVKLAAMDVSVDSEETEQIVPEPSTGAPAATPVSETPAPETPVPDTTTPETPVPFDTSAPTKSAGMPVTVYSRTPVPSENRSPLLVYSAYGDKDREESVAVKLIAKDGGEVTISKYLKWHIRHSAYLFNRLLALLPEDGHMYVALVQRGEHVIQYSAALDKYIAYVSEAEDYLEPLLDERITVFRTMDILEPHIRAGEYVFMKTDHHWTIRGAYYVHKAMIEAQGLNAVPLEDCRITRQPKDYNGLNYKTVEALLPKNYKDYTEEVEPSIPYDFYRVKDITSLTEYPLNNPNDIGYPAILWLNLRPWKMIRSYENTGRKMLLVCDSMGMAFAPFMAYYYDEVHIVRPHETYYSVEQAGGTIKDYIDYYGIDDIYVIQSNFFTGDLYRKTLERSIGDGK